MKMKLLKKGLEFVAVVLALVISVLIVKNLSVESILKGKEEPVSLSMTEDGLPEDFIGRPAGDDIPRLTSAKDWEDAWATSYLTIEPTEIIGTGTGVRLPWVPAYSNSGRRGGTRHKAEVTTMALDLLGEYGEYFIVKLPDGSAILAQMSADTAKSVKAGKLTALPIGRKAGLHQQALAQISDLCRQHNVDTETGLFYCINDTWGESHNFMVQMIRIGAGFLLTLVLGTVFLVILGTVVKEIN